MVCFLVPFSGRSGNTILSERNCGFNLSIIYKCQLQEKTKYQIFTHLTVSIKADDIFYRAGDYLRHQTRHSGMFKLPIRNRSDLCHYKHLCSLLSSIMNIWIMRSTYRFANESQS